MVRATKPVKAERPASVKPDAKTMAGVAAAVGVSIATVSRALNRPEMVAESTRLAVEKAASELSFHPNRAASGLRSGIHKCLALLVGDISQPWYAKSAKAVEAVCDEYGFSLQLRSFGHDQAKMLNYLSRVPHEGIDGVILNTGDDLGKPEVRAALSMLAASGVPLVLVGQAVRGLAVPTIVYDDGGGAEEATRHLIEEYGLPLAFLGSIPNSAGAATRLEGFRREIARHPDPEASVSIVTQGYDYEVGYLAMLNSLRTGVAPRGVLAANDQLALGAMRAISDSGFRVGEDIGVVGFGDLDFAPFTSPSLSTVGGTIGAIDTATRQVIDLVKGTAPAKKPGLKVVSRELIVRDSSRRHPTATRADSAPKEEVLL